MLVNLSDVLTSEGMKLTREVPLEMTCFDNGVESFKVLSKSPVSLVVLNDGVDRAKLTGSVSLVLEAYCGRCLTKVETPLELRFERTVFSPDTQGDEADDMGYMDGFSLDMERLVQNEVLINWPEKILCREDCKGICPVCGRNRNEGECGCDTFVPDPRMAVIQDIFNKSKEV